METQYDQFHFPGFTFESPRTASQGIPTSWQVDLDDSHYIPTLPDDLFDIQMPNNHLFQSCMSNFAQDLHSLFPTSPAHDALHIVCSTMDSQPSPYSYSLPTVPEGADNPPSHNDDIDYMFLNEEIFLSSAGGAEGHESFDTNMNMNMNFSNATGSESSETELHPTSPQVEEVTVRTTSVRENCKNLVSERNRRKRLNQQLLELRAIVPNITKMDKRSVLVDALAYLRSIHEEIEQIQAELKVGERNNHGHGVEVLDHVPATASVTTTPKAKAQILKIDTERMDDRRFIVKVSSKGGACIGGKVLHMIESLGFGITSATMEESQPQNIQTTVFVRVREQGKMTEEKLKHYIANTALRLGLIQNSMD